MGKRSSTRSSANTTAMTATLRWILADVESMIPSFGFAGTVKAVPSIGDPVPSSPLPLPKDTNVALLFTRHMGCPFCEKEIRRVIQLAKEEANKDIRFIIITSVSSYDLERFVLNELGLGPVLPLNVTCFGDAERRVYLAYGLGELSLLNVINKEVMNQVGELRKEGISNRLTRGTRWQTNGGFAIDKQGKVRFVHVGTDSRDMTDLQAAL